MHSKPCSEVISGSKSKDKQFSPRSRRWFKFVVVHAHIVSSTLQLLFSRENVSIWSRKRCPVQVFWLPGFYFHVTSCISCRLVCIIVSNSSVDGCFLLSKEFGLPRIRVTRGLNIYYFGDKRLCWTENWVCNFLHATHGNQLNCDNRLNSLARRGHTYKWIKSS